MSKVERGGFRLTPPPPLKASCNYFSLKASRVKGVKQRHVCFYPLFEICCDARESVEKNEAKPSCECFAAS